MSNKVFQIIFLSAFFCFLSISVNAQKSIPIKTLKVTKKATFIVVGNSAKGAYKATKFTSTKIAKPIIVKSAPKIGKFLLKSSGYTVKKTFPVVKKLFVKYVKYKFIP